MATSVKALGNVTIRPAGPNLTIVGLGETKKFGPYWSPDDVRAYLVESLSKFSAFSQIRQVIMTIDSNVRTTIYDVTPTGIKEYTYYKPKKVTLLSQTTRNMDRLTPECVADYVIDQILSEMMSPKVKRIVVSIGVF